jgi:RES domain-containing protein
LSDAVSVWRIATDGPTWDAADLSGRGAELSGGRWNSPGTPVVYASASRALACLESVVHLRGESIPLRRWLVEIRIPVRLWDAAALAAPAQLPAWDAEPEASVTRTWGDRWVRSGAAAVALVPSVIVPEEINVLVNPRGRDAEHVRAAKVRPWRFDRRLVAPSVDPRRGGRSR